MKRRHILLFAVVTLLAFAAGVWAGNGLSSKQARHVIAKAGNFDLKPEDVHVRRIDVGIGGREAVVEALIQIGFQLTQSDGNWTVTNIRSGDRRWEDLELMTTGIRQEKVKRTVGDLQRLAKAMDAYRGDRNAYPQVSTFSALMDMLATGYLDGIIREDYWHQSYVYRATSTGYRIVSSGPDRKIDTSDDIRLEDGNVKALDSQ